MKRTLFFLLLILISLTFISCGEKLSTINPGLYEINFDLKYSGQVLKIKQRVRYNPDGTYIAANFENNSMTEEINGKYKVEKDTLVIYDNQKRQNIKNSGWTPKEQQTIKIRRIKKESYQYYLEYPDPQTKQKYEDMGLSEGWKTYKRISN